MDDVNAVLREQRRVADAGELQEMRRVDRAGGEDRLSRPARDGLALPRWRSSSPVTRPFSKLERGAPEHRSTA